MAASRQSADIAGANPAFPPFPTRPAGALLGGFLFGSSGPKIEGPRLGDLEVSSSTYGGVIPVGVRRPEGRGRDDLGDRH
jgi:hypothetical protein